MKKQLTAAVPVLVILVVIFSLFYGRSMKLDELIPGLEWSQCTQVEAELSVLDASGVTSGYLLTAQPGDEAFALLVDAVEGKSFSRASQTLFSGNQVDIPEAEVGEALWKLTYQVNGEPIVFRSSGDDIILTYQDNAWQGTIPNMEEWLTNVLTLITQYGAQFQS